MNQECSLFIHDASACLARETHLGGAGRDRTDDILLAKQALSQLSYSPLRVTATPAHAGGSGWIRTNDPRLIKTML